MVTEATHGKDPELAIAALLHDAIEDQQITRGKIGDTNDPSGGVRGVLPEKQKYQTG